MAKSKYELGISLGYVPDWTYVDAIRELFQNALDNQTSNPENVMSFNYDKKSKTLTIANKTSLLTLDSLLLGSSTKRDEENTIGKHGEGYKIAFMVLLREGKSIKVENYGAKELWTTRLVKARRYNNSLIPEITIDKEPIWKSLPNNNLSIEISGITEEEYEAIKLSNLHLQEGVEKCESEYASVLLNSEHRGKMFVNGLYICSKENFKYGYDIKPKEIKLDRDRKLIDSFDLEYLTSKVWYTLAIEHKEEFLSLLTDSKVNDTRYSGSISEYSTIYGTADHKRQVIENLVKSFEEEYGEDAVPVTSNSELEDVFYSGSEVTPIMVSESLGKFISCIRDNKVAKKKNPKELLVEFKEKVFNKLSEEELNDLDIVIDMLK